MAQIFVEPESREGRRLRDGHAGEHILALEVDALRPQVAALAAAYGRRVGDAALIELARNTVATLSGNLPDVALPPDPRVLHAMELVRARLDESIPLRTMAAATHLSAERFRHLFMQETGVGFRAYLLWLRLECALAAFVGGSTLTEAAHTGGFADSAHFSRTFRRMFGIAPASVRLE